MRLKPPSLSSANLLVVLAVLSVMPGGWAKPKFKVLHDFTGGKDGSGPYGSLVFDQRGNMYGTTAGGGNDQKCTGGCGTVFELTPQTNDKWRETVLHSFDWSEGDGYEPEGGVIFDSAGNIFGTTNLGGAHDYGAAFELTPGTRGWTEKLLYSFDFSDGGEPTAGLVIDGAGNLFGTTPDGGAYGGGTVFELTPGSGSWTHAVLHSFHASFYGKPAPGGSNPFAGLIRDRSGHLYGTTYAGGIGCVGEGCGTVFELTLSSGGGWREQVLHSFDNNGKDGYFPGGPLLRDRLGGLYGTTDLGGTIGYGAVFKLTPASDGWRESLVHSFGGGNYGSAPQGGVVMDRSGNLYGVTAWGGNGCACGVAYKLMKERSGKWAYTALHTFTGNDGAVPVTLTFDEKSGKLYGTTILGGTQDFGVIFELTP